MDLYLVPVMDGMDYHHEIEARGVDYIAHANSRRAPEKMREIFPELPGGAEKEYKCPMSEVDLLIGADNEYHLPKLVNHSWDPDDNLSLYKIKVNDELVVANTKSAED